MRFFSNQRLVKKPVLFKYNYLRKQINFSNYTRFFKGWVKFKPSNNLILYKGLLFNFYLKLNTTTYFHRH